MKVFVSSVLAISAMELGVVEAGTIDPFTRTIFVEPQVESSLNLRYSSKSTHFGVFGFGWCSALDLRVESNLNQVLLYGCDLETGNTLDPRVEGKSVLKSKFGFKWQSRAGDWAEFDRKGRLIRFKDFAIEWDRQILTRIERAKLRSRETLFELKILAGRQNPVMTRFGSDNFEYDASGLLVRAGRMRLSYDDNRNLTRAFTPQGYDEGFEYSRLNELIGVWRRTPSGVGRLLLTKAGGETEEQSKIEFKIEMSNERGAEMRPARILYDRLKKELEIDGDQFAAQYLLEWIQSAQNSKSLKEGKSI